MSARRLLLLVALAPLAVVGNTAMAGTVGGLTGTDVSFGQVDVSAGPATAQPVVIQNTDTSQHTIDSVSLTGSSAFALTNQANCQGATLQPNDTCTMSATFDPSTTGPDSANVDISEDSGSSSGTIATLSGTGVSFDATLTPTTWDFGTRATNATGAPDTRAFTLRNSGTQTISVVDSQIANATSGAGFSDDGGCNGATLAPGDTCTVTVTFAPASAGAKSAQLQVNDTATSSPQTADLSGTATAPGISAPGAVDFGNVLPTHTATRTLTVTNNGGAPLNVSSITLLAGSSPPFGIVSGTDTCSGAPVAANGGTCSVQLSYTPAITGTASGTLQIANDAGPTLNVALTGNSISQFVSVSPASFRFTPLTIGKLGPIQTFTLTNKDVAPLTFGATPVRVRGANPHSFAVVSDACANATVAPSGTCQFRVQYTPTAAGIISASVVETDSAPDSPHGVALTSTGLRPPNVTALHGSAGCTAVTMLWKPPTMGGAIHTWIVRNGSRVPRSPFDGVHLFKTRAGVLQNGGLHQFHTYYYAVWTIYQFAPTRPWAYSARAWTALRTGRMCKPQNRAVIGTTVPLLRWSPESGAYAYGLRVFDRGVNILSWSKRTTTPAYRVASSWVYRGVRRRLRSGHTYTTYIYAYTRGKPRGFQIGKSAFTVG